MYIDIHTHGQQPPAGKQVRIVNLPFPPPSPEPPDYYSTGIHPWDAQAGCDSRLRQIEECLSSSPRIIAIGETGLDALKGPEKNIQQQCFVRHIALSEKYHKPLIIHCVKAFPELTALRKKHKPRLSWILLCQPAVHRSSTGRSGFFSFLRTCLALPACSTGYSATSSSPPAIL